MHSSIIRSTVRPKTNITNNNAISYLVPTHTLERHYSILIKDYQFQIFKYFANYNYPLLMMFDFLMSLYLQPMSKQFFGIIYHNNIYDNKKLL